MELLLFIALFYGFILWSAIHVVWRTLHWSVKLVLLPIALFYLLDVALNFTLCTLFFRELPQELTVSERLQRHKATSKVAAFVWREFILKFDPYHLGG